MGAQSYVNYMIAVLFVVCYSYQFFYVLVALFKKQKQKKEAEPNRFAVLISARNEENVIASLIKSIRSQKYPQEMVDIFVVADNCTDDTADTARGAGAIVYERFDRKQVGKGYALRYLLHEIKEKYTYAKYDGYLVLDADNLLDENYIAEMNKSFAEGNRIITSYRNSKNFGTNWISAGYSLWFLREAKFLNNSRDLLKTSCAVSGTGFMVHHDIIEKNDGWKFFLLTEDIEFTIDSVLNGERVAYCGTAVLYDEQPETFMQSWTQRMRWSKGFLQVFCNYGAKLFKNIFVKRSFSSFDMSMSIVPAITLTLFAAILNICSAFISLLWMDGGEFMVLVQSIWESARNAYLLFLLLGIITTISEWKQIHSSSFKKILYTFTFPIFMFTYLPISIVALFKRVEWKPISHSVTKTLEEVRSGAR